MSNTAAEILPTHSPHGAIDVFSRPVHPALRGSVIDLGGYLDSTGNTAPRRELPLVGTPVILTFGAPYRLSDASDPNLPIHDRPFFVAGLHRTYATSMATGPSWSIQANLTPLGACRIFGMPLIKIANAIVAFEDVFGASGRRLISNLEHSVGWDDRLDLVEGFLLRKLERGPGIATELSWSWRQLEQTGGMTRIGAMATELGWSRRHLSARFREQFGLSPKQVARQLRFNSAKQLLLETNQSLADIASELDYADQSHYTREFREFAGETPALFRAVHAAQV